MKQGANAVFVCNNCQSEQIFHLPANSPIADSTVDMGNNRTPNEKAEQE